MKNTYKILISNIGFGAANPAALKIIGNQAHVVENVEGKRFSSVDFINSVHDIDIIVAGTEKIDADVISKARNLKLICRVGSGVDNIDLEAAFANKIQIAYTPDAPSIAVPEFTLGLVLNLIRGVSVSDRSLHEKKWDRPMGQSLRGCRLGIVGAGKIGRQVIKLFSTLEPALKIAFYDPYVDFVEGAQKLSFDEIFKTCNIISLHIPLSSSTRHIVSKKQLDDMTAGSYLINTSRGGIVDEEALYQALQNNLGGAALDVFENEPYSGSLCNLQNCLLTSHIGSMTIEARALMEEQVTEDIINFINNRPLLRPLKSTQ